MSHDVHESRDRLVPDLVSPGNPRGAEQFASGEVTGLNVTWASNGSAYFYGCNTDRFAGEFASAQRVASFGYNNFTYFSGQANKMVPVGPTGPVYSVNADWKGEHTSLWGNFLYAIGLGRVFPMVRHDPPVRDRSQK